jgi:hypothetical protein
MASSVVLPSLINRPRLPDAAQRLQRLVVQRMQTPFGWGISDCALWAADAIEAQLGVDPAHALRGTYATDWQSRHVVARLGRLGGLGHSGGLAGVAQAVLGQPLASPLQAGVGDVGLLRMGALAVCAGESWLAMTSRGLDNAPIDAAVCAWRVGHA